MSEQLLLANRIEQLRQAAIAKDRVEQFDESLALFDEALSLAADEETRELITINKAHAMIGAQRGGPEVQALPMVLMRRRNPRHTFLAAYALLYKHRLSGEIKRSIFYGQSEMLRSVAPMRWRGALCKYAVRFLGMLLLPERLTVIPQRIL